MSLSRLSEAQLLALVNGGMDTVAGTCPNLKTASPDVLRPWLARSKDAVAAVLAGTHPDTMSPAMRHSMALLLGADYMMVPGDAAANYMVQVTAHPFELILEGDTLSRRVLSRTPIKPTWSISLWDLRLAAVRAGMGVELGLIEAEA